MLEVQKYLMADRFTNVALEQRLEALTAELGVKVQLHEHFIGLNYDQIESPKSHPIVMECRALVLDRHTFGVACRTFDRFFNHGECPEFYADFDISRAQVLEKEDGSLIRVWFNQYDSRWEIGTRSMIFAEGDHVMGGTFRDKVLSAFGVDEASFQAKFTPMNTALTYVYEYVGPSNRIVRRYEKEEMVLLAARNNTTGQYSHRDFCELGADYMAHHGLNVRLVKQYDMASFEDIMAAIKELPALEEGYVCFDPVSGKHQKIKNPSYLAIHQIRDNGQLSMKRVYALVFENDHEEYLAYFPEDRASFTPVIESVARLERRLAEVWDVVHDIADQKAFALKVKDHAYSGVLFEARKRQQNPVHVFHGMDLTKKLRIFNL